MEGIKADSLAVLLTQVQPCISKHNLGRQQTELPHPMRMSIFLSFSSASHSIGT